MQVPIKVINNVVQIENFDEFKGKVEKLVKENYKPCLIEDSSTYKREKEVRAELHNLTKLLTSERIKWENETVGTLKLQIKEICGIFDKVAIDFDDNIKKYEINVLNKIPAPKPINTIEVKVYNEEDKKELLNFIMKKGLTYNVK